MGMGAEPSGGSVAGAGPTPEEFLAGRDAPCPRCGYNLRSVRTGQCPECGVVLRPDLAGRDPLARVLWVGWAAFGAMLLSNMLAVWQWWRMIAGGALGTGGSRGAVMAWTSMGVHGLMAVLGVFWLAFVLTRTMPSPRPPIGSPFVASAVQVLALCGNSLLMTLMGWM